MTKLKTIKPNKNVQLPFETVLIIRDLLYEYFDFKYDNDEDVDDINIVLGAISKALRK